MISSLSFSKRKNLRKKESRRACMPVKHSLQRQKEKVKAYRAYIKKIEHGNAGRGYSLKNIIESYYERKITGLAL